MTKSEKKYNLCSHFLIKKNKTEENCKLLMKKIVSEKFFIISQLKR